MAIHQEFACGMCILRDPIYLYKSSTVAKILYTFIKTTLRGGCSTCSCGFSGIIRLTKERKKKQKAFRERRKKKKLPSHIKIWVGDMFGACWDVHSIRISGFSIYHRSFFPSSSFFLVVYYNGYIYSQTCRYYYFRPTKKNMFFFFLLQKSSARIFQFDGSTLKSLWCANFIDGRRKWSGWGLVCLRLNLINEMEKLVSSSS